MIGLFCAAMLLLPLAVHSDLALNWMIMALFYALIGQSWNILGGYGGQMSFGHAAFFGTGAYTSTILQIRFGVNPWIGMAAAALAASAVGGFIGFLSFRYGLRGSYFALVTLAFAEVLRILANSLPFTGEGVGLLIPLRQTAFNLQFPSKLGFYYLALGLCIAALLITWWVEHSRFGARLVAIRENEDAALALGVKTFGIKMNAIMLSGGMAGFAGTFYAQYFLYIDPGLAYGADISVGALLIPLVGGVGSIFGPVLGSFALQSISEIALYLTGHAPGLNLILYGVLLVLMVLFMPHGLFGLARVSAGRLIRGPHRA
jgi:branched-chain amino acid transport system permease protein